APRPPGNRSDRGFIIRRKCPIYRAQTEIATPKGGLMKENLTNLTYTQQAQACMGARQICGVLGD
ncbi:MAG: hypothetical protein OXC38_00930, partial [Gammaproteobacteria bacterium]|nr:hypothetical protein [Gammaproteobacteria bacterium]